MACKRSAVRSRLAPPRFALRATRGAAEAHRVKAGLGTDCFSVIASEAKQSTMLRSRNGLLRFARNDGPPPLLTQRGIQPVAEGDQLVFDRRQFGDGARRGGQDRLGYRPGFFPKHLALGRERDHNSIVCNTNGTATAARETAMSVNVLYRTSAKATGGRDGHAATLDGALDVKLATPKELGGGGGAGNNPEQLFAAGYAACFIGAMKFVASQGGPKVPADTAVTSTVGIGPRAAGGFGLDIQLDISLPGVPRAEAEALVEKAHQVCPYSNATRGNVDVRLTIV